MATNDVGHNYSHGRPLKKPVFVKVSDLQPETRGHNLIVKVGEVKMVLNRTRSDGTKLSIAEAKIGDSTGCILLTARNDQIDIVKPGATVIVRNSKVEMFKGHMRLGVDKWGLIEPAKEELKEDINTAENLSETEYELVSVDS
jgi:replication factor A1